MAKRKFYVSMDYDYEVRIWHGKPKRQNFHGSGICFTPGLKEADMVVNFDADENNCEIVENVWPLLKPCDLKPGEYVEIKVPKLELANG